MKIEITPPIIPNDAEPSEGIKVLCDWCRDTAEKLNIMFGSIDEENLSPKIKERI